MLFWFLIIFIISFLLALRSMSDFKIPKEIRYIIDVKKIKGTILFLKDKIKHYH